MTESLRALLAGAIDYAGMFPPAALPLEQALAKYRQHRSGPEAWMVGRFVCPAAQTQRLAEIFRPKHDGGVTLVVPGADTKAPLPTVLDDALTAVRESPACGDIDVIECRWPMELVKPSNTETLGAIVRVVVGQVAAARFPRMVLYFECPVTNGPHPNPSWSKLVRALGEYTRNGGSEVLAAGFKIRCGGTTAAEIPAAAAIAAAICTCRDEGIFWKATAGLHHPFRRVDPALGVSMHGFINLLTAAVMADVHTLDIAQMQAILEDDDPGHFRFSDEALTWHDLSATGPQIARARDRALRSFGSCSIDEPWQDLTVLGLI